MTVSVESAATSLGTGRGSRTAATPSRITASGARMAAASRRHSGPRRSSPHSTNAATHVTRNAIARSPLRNVSASSTFVTVYVPPKAADRIAGRLQTIAAQHQWALSIRTDSAALADADLAIADSAGTLVSRVRAGSPAAAQARQMADAVLP